MMWNQQGYQKACYDLTSLLGREFSLNTKNPKIRSEFLENAKMTLFFENDNLLIRTQFKQDTRCTKLMYLWYESHNDFGFPSSAWELESLISSETVKTLGIRSELITEFFNDLLSQAMGNVMQRGILSTENQIVKKEFIKIFYEYFALNTAKGFLR